MNKVKICGLKRQEDIEIVNKYLPDFIGFVLAPSKRQISFALAAALKKALHPQIQAVGVFVNEQQEVILEYAKAGIIDLIQLHGDENIAYIESLKRQTALPIIKAVRVKEEADFKGQKEVLERLPVDFFLFDTYTKGSYGGSGTSFNWQLLKNITKPYFIAGGIGLDNIGEAMELGAYGIDMSSKVETEGTKDETKIAAIMKLVKENRKRVLKIEIKE